MSMRELLGKPDPEYGGIVTDISAFPVGTEFEVKNGYWYGIIGERNGKKTIKAYDMGYTAENPKGKLVNEVDMPPAGSDANILSVVGIKFPSPDWKNHRGGFRKVIDEEKESNGQMERFQRWDGSHYTVTITFVGDRFKLVQVFTPDNAPRIRPTLFVRSDDEGTPLFIEIQNEANHPRSVPEYRAYLHEMQIAAESAERIEELFIIPLKDGSFDKGELIKKEA